LFGLPRCQAQPPSVHSPTLQMPLPSVNINAYTARWCRSPRGPLLPVRGCRPYGGCSPTARRARRKLTRAGQFRCSAATVARPVAVRPSMSRKSVPQAKWRDQRWRRGLNRGTDRPVCGSRPCVFAYLWPLHAGHAQANSAAVLPAPRTRGTTCSQTNGAQEKAAGCRQYSQRLSARSRTCRRTARGMASRAIRVAFAVERRLYGS